MAWRTLLPWCLLAVQMSGEASPKRASVASGHQGIGDIDNYLLRYGYASHPRDFRHRPREARKSALRAFQQYHGLRQKGRADRATVSLMSRARCSLPDREDVTGLPAQDHARLRRDATLHTKSKRTKHGVRWTSKVITWGFSRYSSQLHPSSTWRATKLALDLWQRPTTFTFRYDHHSPDIDFAFYSKDHGDRNSFDGRGKLLAHAFAPGDRELDGDVHFDADEAWVLGPHLDEKKTEYFGIVLHEIGHALGLTHTRDADAVMYPMYKGFVPGYDLGLSDINHLQRLYGKNKDYVPPIPKTKATTTTTLPPKSLAYHDDSPRLSCRIHFSDVILGAQYVGYIISRKEIYKITDKGVVTGWPRKLREVFEQAPSNPTAAVYVRETGKTYLFKDTRMWRYTEFRLDVGFPKRDIFHPDKVVAAINIRDLKGRSQVYLFGRKYFWQWSHVKEDVTGPQMLISHFWRGLPTKIHAAVHWRDGYLYFFYANRYYKVSRYTRTILPGYPKFKGAAWLGRNCGYSPK